MKKTLSAFWFAVILITLILCVRCATVHAQIVSIKSDAPMIDGEKAVLIKGRIAGDFKTWLVVEAHNGYQFKDNGYDPCLTRLVVDYMPLFRKLPNGQFEVMFTSPIAKNIP